MAFKKLIDGCDSSDMNRWADSAPTKNFLLEVSTSRAVALRALIKKPTEENAALVRVYDRVNSLIEEARNLK